jgi:hypothetical protein
MTLTARQLTLMHMGSGSLLSYQRPVVPTKLQAYEMTSNITALTGLAGGPHDVVFSLHGPQDSLLVTIPGTITGNGMSVYNNSALNFGDSDSYWQIRAVKIQTEYGTFRLSTQASVLQETPISADVGALMVSF